jgi:hypothetical protein
MKSVRPDLNFGLRSPRFRVGAFWDAYAAAVGAPEGLEGSASVTV